MKTLRFTQDLELEVCTNLDENDEPKFDTETFSKGDEVEVDILSRDRVFGTEVLQVQFGNGSVGFISTEHVEEI